MIKLSTEVNSRRLIKATGIVIGLWITPILLALITLAVLSIFLEPID